ncbi:MAG: hypothetical protein FD167_1021 [bacterium]|nr:MAG: hypothetical protein FD167_1021 [bacterium]
MAKDKDPNLTQPLDQTIELRLADVRGSQGTISPSNWINPKTCLAVAKKQTFA